MAVHAFKRDEVAGLVSLPAEQLLAAPTELQVPPTHKSMESNIFFRDYKDMIVQQLGGSLQRQQSEKLKAISRTIYDGVKSHVLH